MVPKKINMDLRLVPLDKVKPNRWNPNVQSDAVFNALVETIEETGMDEPLLVRELSDGTFEIINGEHRYKACQVLGYDEIPVIVAEDLDDDEAAEIQAMRRAFLRGGNDPVKSTKSFNKFAQKYGVDMAREVVGLRDEEAFNSLIIRVREELPKDMRKDFDRRTVKEEIKTVDDLSRVMNEMFTRYGDTLKQDFMIFTYGGKTHLWISMDKELKSLLIDTLVERMREEGTNMTRFFHLLLASHAEEVLQSDALAESVDEEEGEIEF